jgi:hypothetical protein
MIGVKLASSLLLSSVLILTACNTLVNRRSQYRPSKASGPYTQALKDGTWYKGVKVSTKAQTTPAPKANEPVLPVE